MARSRIRSRSRKTKRRSRVRSRRRVRSRSRVRRSRVRRSRVRRSRVKRSRVRRSRGRMRGGMEGDGMVGDPVCIPVTSGNVAHALQKTLYDDQKLGPFVRRLAEAQERRIAEGVGTQAAGMPLLILPSVVRLRL